MTNYNDILLIIKNKIYAKKLAISTMAKDINMNRGTLTNYVNGITIMPLDEFLRICDYLDLGPECIFNKEKIQEKKIDYHKTIDDFAKLLKEKL